MIPKLARGTHGAFIIPAVAAIVTVNNRSLIGWPVSRPHHDPLRMALLGC